MRVRSAPPQWDDAVSAIWLDGDSDGDSRATRGVESGLDNAPGGGCAEDLAGAVGAFSERFAAGTGQFHVPRSRLALRGSPDDPLSRIMTRKVVCARPEMDASLLRARLLERGVSGAPVVDDWGRVLGVVSKTDLIEHEVTSQRGCKTVGDIMMQMVFTLPPDASIGQAAALMAYEGVHRVVVVDAKCCVVGLVSSLDIARWIGWCARFPSADET
jgi:CBS-domain-containing membrane protein